MKNTDTKMSRGQMQTNALVIENLLNAAQALYGTNNDEAVTLVEMATGYASRLNLALDSKNAPEWME